GLIVDVTERTFQMERILFEAQHDALTQLFNRRAGEQLLNIMLANARNNQGQLAVLLIDLDDFKLINDTHGHEAGDKVLVEIARRMQLTVRKEDILVRMGGDEFIITLLIKDGNRDEIDQVVNKLQKQFTAEIEVGSDRSVTIGASIGVALFPQDGGDIETLIAHADIDMYQIKKNRKTAYSYLLSTQSTE
ncbi:MAG: GGDEF domain-containing protein, partial [Pseudomonadota bacterium]